MEEVFAGIEMADLLNWEDRPYVLFEGKPPPR
jgi:hypothetical protein